MTIYAGSIVNEPSLLWYGNNAIHTVYHGSEQIWPSEYEPESVVVSAGMIVNEPSGVKYSLSAKPQPEKGRYRFDWDFGDGTTMLYAGNRLEHVFGHDKTYPIVVTLSNGKGTVTGSRSITTPAHPWTPQISYTRTRAEVVGDQVYFEGYFSVSANVYPVEVKAAPVYEGTIYGPLTKTFVCQHKTGGGSGVTGIIVTASNEHGSTLRQILYFYS